MPNKLIKIDSSLKIDSLYKDLSSLIEKSKQKAISQAKSTVNLLFWQIGKRINGEILNNKRADYGKQIIPNLANTLSAEYGRSFEEKNLRRMLQFAECFPDKKIVVTLSRQLSWSHIIILLPLNTFKEPYMLDFLSLLNPHASS